MQIVPPGYSIRTATMIDLPHLTRLANAYARRWTGRNTSTEEQLRAMLSTPGLDLATSVRLVHDLTGELAAAGLVFHRDPHVTVHVWGLVAGTHQGRGIGACLHDWILERSKDAVDIAPVDMRVVVRQSLFDGDEAARTFLDRAGYTLSRHYWRMTIDLDGPPASPAWKDEFVLTRCDPKRDLEALIRASWDAFQDHYGFVAGSIDDELERTRHRIETDPNTDPSLWLLLWDGDEIAGFCTCSPRESGDEATGYVQALGVRPAWRRRGLGRALLLEAFTEFHRRGMGAVALHVDAQGLTGATQLYESVGMRVAELSHEHELEIRPGVDLSVRNASA